MKARRRLVVTALIMSFMTAAIGAAETKEELTKRLWPRSRVLKALTRIEELRTSGMMSVRHFERKNAMLQTRLAGTFQPTMLAVTNPPLNFIQNGGFEEINKNSRPDRSRWLWWGGWSWGGDYENRWEDQPEFVKSGKLSARIRCLGQRGRIGLMTPKLPVIAGASEYEFSIWAKGEGNNQLFLNFESGARGTFRERIGSQWQRVAVKGTLEPNADGYTVCVYVTGEGTIWLDDAKLVPVGGQLDD